MKKLSVIIPYFQREIGILRKALGSIQNQTVPGGWEIEAVVVDDGSPVSARQEIDCFNFTGARKLMLIEQKNAGPGAARNRALDASVDTSEAIAFLDSDDVWPDGHIARGIEALECGYDFYFTDNHRAGMHQSQIAGCARSAHFINSSRHADEILEIPQSLMVGFCISEFPCQASTIVAKAKLAREVRFPSDLSYSGEDVVFFTNMLALSNRIAFDPRSSIECGGGVNIYFGNLDWSSPKILGIKVDHLLTYRNILKIGLLDSHGLALAEAKLEAAASDVGFHFTRNLVKRPCTVASQAMRLVRQDSGAAMLVARSLPRALIERGVNSAA